MNGVKGEARYTVRMNAVGAAPETAPEALPDTLLTMLQDLRLTLSVLNRAVGQHFSVNEVDLDCLDILFRHGPHAPGQLAQRMGLHLATMTGVLDRLERGGWVVRERSRSDRRRVLVRADAVQSQRVTEHYAHAAQELRGLCSAFPESDLRVVVDFLRRASEVQSRPVGGQTALMTTALLARLEGDESPSDSHASGVKLEVHSIRTEISLPAPAE